MEIQAPYIKTDKPNVADDLMANFLRVMPPELKIAMMNGCQVDILQVNGTLRVVTKNKISVLKNSKGEIINVFVEKLQ